jgi:peptide/nickel transport system substrate-binding protein
MRRIAYLFLAAISLLVAAASPIAAETRPHYGGTLRVMMQAAPGGLELPTNAANAANITAADSWDIARTLSLIGDTLVTLDAQDRPRPALAVVWHNDDSARHWQFTLRHGVRFHDGSAASPSAVAQILGALHSDWTVHSSTESVSIDSDVPMPSLLAELALPRNLLLKRDPKGVPIGTGPFLVVEWQPGKLLKLAANEESWAGRPFVDAVQIEFGKSFSDQAIALELDKADVIEVAPSASIGPPHIESSSSFSSSFLSLPVELLALVFPANSKAQDPRVREALALAIDRKPIQSVLLKGAGEPTASILPNWMTGYSAIFSAQANLERARALLAGLPRPVLNLHYNLSYDPRDLQAQLIAERIALNAHEAGITVQVSLSGAEDIRLMRVVLPSPDPATSLAEAARQLELPQLALAAKAANNGVDDIFSDGRLFDDHSSDTRSLYNRSSDSRSLDNLYRAERSLLQAYTVIPLVELPVATVANARVRNWAPDRLGAWSDPEFSLASIWLRDGRSPADSR